MIHFPKQTRYPNCPKAPTLCPLRNESDTVIYSRKTRWKHLAEGGGGRKSKTSLRGNMCLWNRLLIISCLLRMYSVSTVYNYLLSDHKSERHCFWREGSVRWGKILTLGSETLSPPPPHTLAYLLLPTFYILESGIVISLACFCGIIFIIISPEFVFNDNFIKQEMVKSGNPEQLLAAIICCDLTRWGGSQWQLRDRLCYSQEAEMPLDLLL